MAAISPTVFKAAIKRALAEGEAKGRRLERRALKQIVKDWGYTWRGVHTTCNEAADKILLTVGAARSKRGKVWK
jgi:hypothetical protein